jgi:cell division protein FtsQ
MTDGGRRWRLVRARGDAVPASVRRFSARARARRLRAARPWLLALAVLAVLGGLYAVVFATPLLGVADVRVRGVHLLTADEVRAAVAVRPGTPLARVDLAAVTRRVDRLSPVARATVSRDWPDALTVRVVERTPAAAVPVGGGFTIVDADGVAFDSVPQRPAGLPVVAVPAPGPSDPTTRAALTVLGALTPELRAALVSLVADAPTRIRLELSGGRSIIWGDASASVAKAQTVTGLLAARGKGKVIDVSALPVVTMGER